MQKGNKPLISVVMPIYNQAHLVSNAINSIKNQTIDNWEFIIIDDGSEDNVKEVVAKFDDDRITLISSEHGGMVCARNLGNSFARADVIALQDADDLSLPDRLEKSLKAIKNADVVYHGLYINMWDTQFNCIGRKYVPAQRFDKKRLLKGQYIPGACVFKKNVWEKKPFRYETSGQFDYMMHLDWVFSGFRYKALNEGLYEYVRHEGSSSITMERTGKRTEARELIKRIMSEEYEESLS